METQVKDIKEKISQANPEKREGKVASMIEEQTAKLPSDVFLWTSLAIMAASLTMKVMRKNDGALFVGLWVPAFLLFGVYNKLVKQMGHDSKS